MAFPEGRQNIHPKLSYEAKRMGDFTASFDWKSDHHLLSGAKYTAGWWARATPLKKYEFVKWDDDIPNIWEHKKWQPNHQPDIFSHVSG